MWKKIWKKLLVGTLIPIILAFLAGAGVLTWYFFIRETPRSVFEDTIAAARQRNVEDFKGRFSTASVRALESSWSGETSGRGGSWISMMEGILDKNGGPPELLDEEIVEQRATLKVRLEERRRTIFFIKDDGDWRIDLLVGIDAGLSDEARKAQKTTASTPEDAKKEEELLEEPKKEGWWK